MKELIRDGTCRSGPARGRLSRTSALMAALAICACTAVRLEAAVIDDFENGVKWAQGGGGTNYFVWGLTNGQMVICRQNPIPTPNPGVLTTYDSVYWPPPCLPAGNLEGGRTLELRMDLIHASTDDLFLFVGSGGRHSDGADSAYFVLIDRNEVALMKYKYPGGMTTFYWDLLPTTNENVTVGIAFTKTNSSLAITVKIVAKGNERVTLYERTFVDGPGQDGPVPPPDPHGYGFFGPDLGVPYTNFTYAAVGCSQLIFSSPPPLEMLLDNLEYDVYHPPHLEISPGTNGVDLTWLLPLEEQIVVQADQLTGPWCPCPQPYTRTGDAFCLTIPCQSQQKFFKLKPGIQFTDYFSNAVPTWRPFFNQPGTDEFIVTNGVLQLNWHGPLSGDFGLRPPGPDIEVGDFYMSVDVLDWMTSGTNWSTLGLAARASLTTGLSVGGGLAVNTGGVRGQVRPLVWQNQQETSGPDFDTAQFPPPYRLQFWAVGPNLHFRVLSLTTGQIIREVTETDTTGTQGFVFLWINAPSGQFQSHTITADNFFVNGTKP